MDRDRRDDRDERRARVAAADSGPTPDEIKDALDAILDHDIPGTPPVWALRTLREMGGREWAIMDRKVKSFTIKEGQPEHGAMPSAAHVGRYVVEHTRECPECNHERAIYQYRTMGNIAGSASDECKRCGEVHHSDEWG